ncbi:hypothetical protein WJX73_008316 [Symbiochloris irregularis]|uniref:Uncharacterized protein n=1 Tax=Symbiochloris irregularis TaxID=706552 RepID=A0AAW1NQ47_9CHLO
MAAQLESEKAEKVKKQVEFYFSDSNAPRDKFLLQHIQADPEGFVDLAVICKFSRMQAILFPGKQFDSQCTVGNDLAKQVGEALRPCQSLQVNEEGTRVKRATELDPEAAVKGVDERSLYAAPFPFDATLERLSAFWSSVGPTNGVRLRRHAVSKDFKGSVFVEFSTQEAMKEVLGKDLEFEHAALRMEPKLEYMARKQGDRSTALLVEVAEGHASDAAAEAPADDATPNAAEATPDAAQATPDAAQASPPEAAASAQAEPEEYEPGCIVRVAFAAQPKLAWTAVKEAFGGSDRGVRFVELSEDGDEQLALVRFDSHANAEGALQKRDGDGKIAVEGNSGSVSLLEGEQESAMYKKWAESRKQHEARRAQGGNARGRGRGRGFKRDKGGGGGRGRGAKRGRR